MILTTVVVAVALGIAAQVVAERLKVPAILPLLLLGILAGPNLWALFGVAGGGLIDPAALGEGLEVFIHLGIAVILFEGGLSLDPRQLRRVGGAVRNLLTVGVAVTGIGSAWLFHAVTGRSWAAAALFGAIVTVTGPTVIVPLLRHMVLPRRLATILVSEGLIVDPVGAVLAYLVLQTIDRPGMPLGPLAGELATLTLVGAVFGLAAAFVARAVARSRWTGGELNNLAILAVLMLCFLLAERQAPQSGVIAAVVMGLAMSGANIPDLAQLRVFKGQLTVLLISVLFILLAGQLDLFAVLALGTDGLLVVAGMILLVRPASVFLAVRPSQVDLKGRTVLALTAPRGVVAAAVASLAARQLEEAGLPGGAEIEGMVYLVILVTVIWATAMALLLPRAMGYTKDPKRWLIVLVGAHAVSAALGRALKDRGREVVVVDSSATKLEPLLAEGLTTIRGDARDAATFEQAGVQRDTQVVALTTNDELNLLVAELVRGEFAVEHPVVALQRVSEEFGTVRRAWTDLLGGRAIDLPAWIHRLESGEGRLVTLDLGRPGALDAARRMVAAGEDGRAPLVAWRNGLPAFRLRPERLEDFEELSVLAPEPELARELAALVAETEAGGPAVPVGGGGPP
ncbi:MAG TPA: cation:proton antiporter [Thermoanaerobaculia bacterium]|nr:cation:proton antiporter [Thermoanaerobaculia bacterium]